MGVINLDLTEEIDFLPALRISVNTADYNPVKGNTLLLCPKLERILGIVTSLFFSFLPGATKSLSPHFPHLGFHLKFHWTILEVSSVQILPRGDSVKGMKLEIEDTDSSSGLITVV